LQTKVKYIRTFINLESNIKIEIESTNFNYVKNKKKEG